MKPVETGREHEEKDRQFSLLQYSDVPQTALLTHFSASNFLSIIHLFVHKQKKAAL